MGLNAINHCEFFSRWLTVSYNSSRPGSTALMLALPKCQVPAGAQRERKAQGAPGFMGRDKRE